MKSAHLLWMLLNGSLVVGEILARQVDEKMPLGLGLIWAKVTSCRCRDIAGPMTRCEPLAKMNNL